MTAPGRVGADAAGARDADSPSRRGPVPGDVLLHPATAVAAAAIALNVWVVRVRWPGLVSGKLSDLGICFLLPVLLFAAWEWAAFAQARIRGRTWRPGGAVAAAVSALLAAGYFSALQLSPAFARAHVAALATLLTWRGFGPVTLDPTDLLALAVTPAAVWFLRRRRARG